MRVAAEQETMVLSLTVPRARMSRRIEQDNQAISAASGMDRLVAKLRALNSSMTRSAVKTLCMSSNVWRTTAALLKANHVSATTRLLQITTAVVILSASTTMG